MGGGWFCFGGLGGTLEEDDEGLPTDRDGHLPGLEDRDASDKCPASVKISDEADTLAPMQLSQLPMRPGAALPGLMAVLQEFKTMSDGVPYMPASSITSVLQHLPVPVIVLNVAAACVSVASTSFGDGRSNGGDGRGALEGLCSAFVPQVVYINPAGLAHFQVVSQEVFKHLFNEQLARCSTMVEMLMHTSRLRTFCRKRFSSADVWPQLLERQIDVEAASCYLPLQSNAAGDFSTLSPGLVLSYSVCPWNNDTSVTTSPTAAAEAGAAQQLQQQLGGGGSCIMQQQQQLGPGGGWGLDMLMVEHTDYLMCLFRLDGSIVHQNAASRAYMSAKPEVLSSSGPSRSGTLETSGRLLRRPSGSGRLDRSNSTSKAGSNKLSVSIASDLGSLFQLDLASLDRLLDALKKRREWRGTVRIPANGQLLHKSEPDKPPGSWDPESVDNIDIDDVESPETSTALASMIGRDHLWHDMTAKLVAAGSGPGMELILLSHNDVTNKVQSDRTAAMKGQHARMEKDTTPSLDPVSEQQQQQREQQAKSMPPQQQKLQQQLQQLLQAQQPHQQQRQDDEEYNPRVEDVSLFYRPAARQPRQQQQQDPSTGYSGFRVPTVENVAMLEYDNRNLRQPVHREDTGPCPRALDPFALPSPGVTTSGAPGGQLVGHFAGQQYNQQGPEFGSPAGQQYDQQSPDFGPSAGQRYNQQGPDFGPSAGQQYHPQNNNTNYNIYNTTLRAGGGDDTGPCPRAFDPFAPAPSSHLGRLSQKEHDMFAAAGMGRGYEIFGGTGLGGGPAGRAGGRNSNVDSYVSDSLGPCPRALDPFAGGGGGRGGGGGGGDGRMYDPFGSAAVGGPGGLRTSPDNGPCPRAFDPFAAASSGPRFAKVADSQDKLEAFGTRHEQVTVMCADVVGLTSMCKHIPPSTVMTLLNGLYSHFDMLACIFNVHKVETAGNCYMVAGGLMHKDEGGCTFVRNDVDPLHALTVLEFGKVLLSKAGQVLNPMTNEPLQLRISMHSGPVVSGVIGTMMPHFCLFGDTVTSAQRMHASSPPGTIHVSEATRNLLPDERWQCTAGVEMQGAGTCQTYMLAPNSANSNRSLRDEYVREQYMLQAGLGMDSALSRCHPHVRLYM